MSDPLSEVTARLIDGSVYDVTVRRPRGAPWHVTIGQIEGVVIAYCGCPAFKFSAEFPKTCKHVSEAARLLCNGDTSVSERSAASPAGVGYPARADRGGRRRT